MDQLDQENIQETKEAENIQDFIRKIVSQANDDKNPNQNLDSENINTDSSNKKRKNKRKNNNNNKNNNNKEDKFVDTPEKNLIKSPSLPKNISVSPENLLKEGNLNKFILINK
jgi:hypothetical protein